MKLWPRGKALIGDWFPVVSGVGKWDVGMAWKVMLFSLIELG